MKPAYYPGTKIDLPGRGCRASQETFLTQDTVGGNTQPLDNFPTNTATNRPVGATFPDVTPGKEAPRGAHPRRKIGQAKAVHDPERQARAIEMKLAGKTYREIGAALDITRQRAQQLIKPSFQTIAAVRGRAKDCCEKCAAPVQGHGHVHHIAPQADYNALSNLLYLCISCHRQEHNGYFTELPPALRREASEAFAQPYLGHIEERFCMACGASGATLGLCDKCRDRHKNTDKAKAYLTSWRKGEAKTSAHALSKAIYIIRKNKLTPEDFGPEVRP